MVDRSTKGACGQTTTPGIRHLSHWRQGEYMSWHLVACPWRLSRVSRKQARAHADGRRRCETKAGSCGRFSGKSSELPARRDHHWPSVPAVVLRRPWQATKRICIAKLTASAPCAKRSCRWRRQNKKPALIASRPVSPLAPRHPGDQIQVAVQRIPLQFDAGVLVNPSRAYWLEASLSTMRGPDVFLRVLATAGARW